MKLDKFNIARLGRDYVFISSEEEVALRALGNALYKRNFHFIEEVIVSEREIGIKLSPSFSEEDIERLGNIELKKGRDAELLKLPIYFTDGEDWRHIEENSGQTKDQIIEMLLGQKFYFAMYGFLPGFMYIGGFNEGWSVPRKAIPDKKIEVNSVALGGRYLGIYTIESPGGWNVIGKTPLVLFDPDQPNSARVEVGSQFEIQHINLEEYDRILKMQMNITAYNER